MNIVPPVNEGESLDEYYQRTTSHWITQAMEIANEEGLQVSERQVSVNTGNTRQHPDVMLLLYSTD